MRASVSSLSKKFISTFFAAALAVGLVPAAAFAVDDGGESSQQNSEFAEANSDMQAEAEASAYDNNNESLDGSNPVADASASASGEEGIEDEATTGDDLNLSIPAATERINEDMALTTRTVAQAESTRSYFLAQTLESTRTIPMVSANLPLDTSAIDSADESDAPAEGEGGEFGEDEGSEDSDDLDDSDDPDRVISTEASDSERSGEISADSTVIGSFTYLGMTFAVEPGGETVAVVASDYSKLPEKYIEENTIVVPSAVTADCIDYYTVSRIADYAFASLTAEAASARVISTEASDSERSGEIPSEEESDETVGITVLGIPASITSIDDAAFSGFETLQYIVVEEGNPNYASYDGALYSASLDQLRLIPEGRVGTVRVAPSATTVEPEVFSHCPSVTTVVADPASEIYDDLHRIVLSKWGITLSGEDGYMDANESAHVPYSVFDECYADLADSVLIPIISIGDRDTGIQLDGRASFYGVGDAISLAIVPGANGHVYIDGAEHFDTASKPITTYSHYYASWRHVPSNVECKYQLYYQYPVGTNHIVTFKKQGYIVSALGLNSSLDSSAVNLSIIAPQNEAAAPIYLTASGWVTPAWSAKTSALTFNLQGGSWKSGETLKNNLTAIYDSVMPEIVQNGITTKMTVPTKSGYTFAGFYDKTQGSAGANMYYKADLSSNQSWNKDTLENTELYAWWTKRDYVAISLVNDKASSATVDTAYYWPGKGIVLSSTSETLATKTNKTYTKASADGWNFTGYYDGTSQMIDADGKLTDSGLAATPSSATSWTSKWTKKPYVSISLVNDKDNDSTVSTAYYWPDKGIVTGSTSETLATKTNVTYTKASANGWNFSGYYSGNTQMIDSSGKLTDSGLAAKPSEATSWTSKWTKKTYVSITLKNDKSNGTVDTAYYWPDKGIVIGSTSETMASKSDPTYKTPSEDGWKFLGYYSSTTQMIDADGHLTDSGLAAKPTSATTWTSKWEKNAYVPVALRNDKDSNKTVDTAYYWPGKGFVTGSTSETLASNSNPTYAKASATGYTFTGYYSGNTQMIDENGHLTDDGLKAKPSSGTVWTSKWDLNYHTVSWRYDGGNGGDDGDESKAYGSEFHLKNPGAKAGYKFTGWKASGTADNGNTYDESYLLDKLYKMPDGNVTFTAQWSAHDYTKVTLSDSYLSEATAQGEVWYWPEQGYVASADSKTVIDYGKHIKDVPNLKSLGYQFLGWFDDVNENKNATKMIDENGNVNTQYAPAAPAEGEAIVWYAHWERTSCPVDLVAAYAPNSEESAFAVTDSGTASIPYARFGVALSESVDGARIEIPQRTGYTFLGYYALKYPEVSVESAKDGAFTEAIQWIDRNGNVNSTTVWNERPTDKRGKISLYAAWRLDDCAVTFDPAGNVNGVEQNKEQVTVVSEPAGTIWNYGKAKKGIPVSSESTFYRTGYEFAGWYYTEDGTLSGEKVFVSDKLGDPTPANWDAVKTSVTLWPAWTAKKYTVRFHNDFPQIEGSEMEGSAAFEPVEVSYDQTFDLSGYVPSFGLYEFAGWYTATEQLFEGAHMTANADGTRRFAPKGSVAKQDPIDLHALWSAPGMKTYHLYVKSPGTDDVVESVHDYYYTDTVKFNGTEAPASVDGYLFEGWVEFDDDELARAAAAAGVDEDAKTTGGFGPYSNRHRYFVAKWSKRELGVTFLSERTDDGTAWLTKADRLKDYEGDIDWSGEEAPLSWTRACEGKESRPDLASGLSYDVDMAPFVLPDVARKGQVFKGWRLLGDTDANARRGMVVDPADQKTSTEKHRLVYVPVFEDAVYTIVLDGNGYGEDQVFYGVPYSDAFEFPYPVAKKSGAAFVCWATDSNTASTGTRAYAPLGTAPIAPVYDEAGENVEEFGLAQLDEEDRGVIRLYAVWHAKYNVELPLFANLAIDTESGDVIAGANTVGFSEKEDADAVYRIESIRYEPRYADGRVAFEGAPPNEVFLSVYAGLDLGENSDEEHLLYAGNVGERGELAYTDAKGETQKATPLLIELGGTDPVLYTRTAPEGQTSLSAVTDEDAPYGFVTFSAKSPLTIRYGLFFEDPQTRKDFAFGSGKYDWLLPEADAKNDKTSVDTTSSDYGRRPAWSSDVVEIAKLRYTVSVSSTE